MHPQPEMNPETQALQQKIAAINSLLVTVELNHFADRLVEKTFLSHQSMRSILNTHGYTKADQVSRLMESVMAQVGFKPKKFKDFVKILSADQALHEITDELTKTYRSLGGELDIRDEPKTNGASRGSPAPPHPPPFDAHPMRHFPSRTLGICIFVVILAVAIVYFSMESKVSSVESTKNWMEIIRLKKSLIQEAAPKVNAKWKLIGRHLGISENVLNDIQSQVARMPDSNMRAFELMVEKWKNLKTSAVVIETFMKALESPEVGKQAVAKSMRDEIEAFSQKLDKLFVTIEARVNKKWRLIGEQLGMSSNDLDYIQSVVAARPAEHGFQLVLNKTRICCPLTYDTWSTLITALNKVGEDTVDVTYNLEYVLKAITI